MKTMKTKLTAALIGAGLLLIWNGAAAAENEKPITNGQRPRPPHLYLVAAAAENEKTITGEGKCAKCSLKETEKCQTAVVVEEDGKKVTYYLKDNQVSKDFHDNICKTTAKVKATGKVKDVAGKMELTATKIELVKD